MTRLASTRPSIVVVVVVTFRSTSPTSPMLASASTFTGVKVAAKATVAKTARRANVVTRAGQYDDELLQTAVRRVFFYLYSIVSSSRARHQCASAINHQSHRAIGAHHRSIDRRVDDARRATTDAGDCARNQPWDFYLETNPSVVARRGVADDGTTPPTTGRRVGRGETLPGFVVGAFPPSFPPHPEEKRIRFSSTFGCG